MISPDTFRACMGRFATGVTVVTTRAGDQVHGMTVNSFTSVSLHPPLVLFCPNKLTRTLELIREGGVFAINVLAEEQKDLCLRFAGMTELEDRFVGLAHQPGPATGCPLFSQALAHLECRKVDEREAGDHVIVVGEVIGLDYHDGRPLLFYSSGYPRLA